MPSNVVTLSSQDIQRKRLQREGRSVFIEFFAAPGCDIAEARVAEVPDGIDWADIATWCRSFAHEIDKMEEEYEKNTATDEPQ